MEILNSIRLLTHTVPTKLVEKRDDLMFHTPQQPFAPELFLQSRLPSIHQMNGYCPHLSKQEILSLGYTLPEELWDEL
ncbi:hypothetical protein H6F87_27370 [Cyanobacteria bacterium FACHB-502]|nr:hypothetical protein [Cyanobacteria bacterium FACHB-502]